MAGEAFSLARVIGRVRALAGRNVALAGALCIVLGAAPTAAVEYAFAAGSITELLYNVANLPLLLPGVLLQGSLLAIALTDLAGERPRLGATLRTALRRFFPLVLTNILFSITVGLGLLLLIVPALILTTLFAVAGPVTVGEDRLGAGALARSRELTQGLRWKIFAAVLIVILLMAAMATLLVALGMAVAEGTPWALVAAQAAVAGLMPMITEFGSASLYAELKRVKHGPDAAQVAEVFA